MGYRGQAFRSGKEGEAESHLYPFCIYKCRTLGESNSLASWIQVVTEHAGLMCETDAQFSLQPATWVGHWAAEAHVILKEGRASTMRGHSELFEEPSF